MNEEEEAYLEPSESAAVALFSRNISGEIAMLNLLRFREVADYSDFPGLSPPTPISGRAAYERYITHTLPFLEASEGRILVMGAGGDYLVGPPNQGWDMVILVLHSSIESFMAFASNEAYLAGIGHRTAAVRDSRILPLTEITRHQVQ